MKKLVTSKKILVIIVAVLALSLIILLIGKSGADRQAREYQNQADSFAQKSAEIQQQAESIDYASKIVIGRYETEPELQAIKTECAKADTLAKNAKQVSKNISLADNNFGFLSSAYKSAQSNVVETDDVQTIGDKAATLAHACSEYVEDVELAIKYDKYSKEREALIQPQSALCDDEDGCIVASDELEYKKYYEEVVAGSKAYIQHIEEGCGFKEVQKMCDISLAYYKRHLPLQQAYYDALGVGGLTEASDAFDANPYPEQEMCDIAIKITGDSTLKEYCLTHAYKAVAARYETEIKAAAADL